VIENVWILRYLKVTMARHSYEYFQNQLSHTGVTKQTTGNISRSNLDRADAPLQQEA
jgi:DNA-binding XRE family transcriptional regulator